MSSRQLAETTVNLIEAKIKADIEAVLAELRTDRADAKVSTEAPRSYFKYAGPKGYRVPAVFTICDSMDMHNIDKASNAITATARVMVSVLIEDRLKELLVVKAWRYQAALHKILHETTLTSVDSRVKLVCKVESMHFSPEFSETVDEKNPSAVFRKEVAIECEVEHYEKLD
jgi:hypothetical protein